MLIFCVLSVKLDGMKWNCYTGQDHRIQQTSHHQKGNVKSLS